MLHGITKHSVDGVFRREHSEAMRHRPDRESKLGRFLGDALHPQCNVQANFEGPLSY